MEIRQPQQQPTRHDLARLRARVVALESGLDLLAEAVAPRLWAVPSRRRPGTVYLVKQERGRLACDCRAGSLGRPCCHAEGISALLERRATAHRQAGAMVN